MILSVPVEPDADEARDLLIRELSKPVYREAEPNWFDRLSSAFWDWLTGLFSNAPGSPPSLLLGVLLLVLVAAVIAAYIIFGPPRLNRRSAVTGALFGDDDARDAAAIRSSAEAAAARGEWPLAIEEMFRAVARSLAERAILTTSPGTTATSFAVRAAQHFPESTAELDATAATFDRVRYLGGSGSEAEFRRVEALERGLRSARPRLDTAEASA